MNGLREETKLLLPLPTGRRWSSLSGPPFYQDGGALHLASAGGVCLGLPSQPRLAEPAGTHSVLSLAVV